MDLSFNRPSAALVLSATRQSFTMHYAPDHSPEALKWLNSHQTFAPVLSEIGLLLYDLLFWQYPQFPGRPVAMTRKGPAPLAIVEWLADFTQELDSKAAEIDEFDKLFNEFLPTRSVDPEVLRWVMGLSADGWVKVSHA